MSEQNIINRIDWLEHNLKQTNAELARRLGYIEDQLAQIVRLLQQLQRAAR